MRIPEHTNKSYQASSTVRVTLARSSTALASLSRTGVRSRRSAPSCSTTSRLSNKCLGAALLRRGENKRRGLGLQGSLAPGHFIGALIPLLLSAVITFAEGEINKKFPIAQPCLALDSLERDYYHCHCRYCYFLPSTYNDVNACTVVRAPCTYHDDVVAEFSLDLGEFRVACSACFHYKCNLFKLGVQTSFGLPS